MDSLYNYVVQLMHANLEHLVDTSSCYVGVPLSITFPTKHGNRLVTEQGPQNWKICWVLKVNGAAYRNDFLAKT